MAYHYQLHPQAFEDISSAVGWYEDRRKGLGTEFFSAYLALIDQILQNPLLYAVEFATIRSANLRNFPYRVYYALHENTVYVYSVFHQKREPDSWKERLQ